MKISFLNIFFSSLLIIGFTLSNTHVISTFSLDDDFVELSENLEKEIEEESEEKKEESESEKITFVNNHTYSNWYCNTISNFNHGVKNSIHYFEIPNPPPELG